MITKFAKLFTIIGFLSMLVCIVIFFSFDKNVAPELSGRAELTALFDSSVTEEDVSRSLKSFEELDIKKLPSGSFILSTKPLTEEKYSIFIKELNKVGEYKIEKFETFSSLIANNLLTKSILAIMLSAIIIIIFISIVFSRISRPVSSWKYGVISIIALAHDILLPLGFIIILGTVLPSARIDFLFITALLAILGYSINDTIVVFDRIRENLDKAESKKGSINFGEIINSGVKLSLTRSIYTSLTTVVSLALLFIFVPSVAWFSIILFIGISVGTYSSLFFAPSLLYMCNHFFPEKDKAKKIQSEIERAEEDLMRRVGKVDTI